MKLLAATLMSLALLVPASAQDSQAIRIVRRGTQPSRQGPSENFTGSVRVDHLFQANAPARTSGSLVTFEPGARSAWHTHPHQLRSHLVRARENGVTREELIETITHLAFYAGWPNAVTAIAVAKEVFEKK